MNIFVSHASSSDYKKELYQPIRQSDLNKKHRFILPHESSSVPYETKALFASKICALIVAECSYPSTGQGIEIGWANVFKIPILCIHKKGTVYSGALKVVVDDFLEYADANDMIKKLEIYLKRYV
jgi:hypothetical protein